ncbi:MAG: hypothetical protein KAS15_05345 [Nanoarchaeota archaeon]|nr:hypothetical protein [Nanoarchaeota archaeon]
MSKNKNIILDLWSFVRLNKKWWLLPLLVLLLLLGILIIAGETTSLSPFIYALF